MTVYHHNTGVYLFDDEYKALMMWITARYGLEVPYDFVMPTRVFLRDTIPKNPVTKWESTYYVDGGNQWPDRWMIYEEVHD